MGNERPVGGLLDQQGVSLDLDDDDLVESVLVIAKVVKPDGSVQVVLGDSVGMSWLEQLGLVTAADDIVRSNLGSEDD